jgi:hypothetical protein
MVESIIAQETQEILDLDYLSERLYQQTRKSTCSTGSPVTQPNVVDYAGHYRVPWLQRHQLGKYYHSSVYVPSLIRIGGVPSHLPSHFPAVSQTLT